MKFRLSLNKNVIAQISYIFINLYGINSALSCLIVKDPFSFFIVFSIIFFIIIDTWLLIDDPPLKIEVSFIDNFIDRGVFNFFIGCLFNTNYVKYNKTWSIFWVASAGCLILYFCSFQNFTPLLNQVKPVKSSERFMNAQEEELQPLNP